MVAVVRGVSSAGNAGRYFYWTERDCECARGWQDTRGCRLLGLGELRREGLEGVLEGRIVEAGKEIQLGRKEAGEVVHSPGQELILSAPKSVSIMALVAGDERIHGVHERAVERVVDYVERNMVYTRVQEKGNMVFEKTDNMVAAKFTHLTSRPTKKNEGHIPDPQLHTHCIVANMTKCQDGAWRSLVFDKLYENKMHIGELYRMELAHGLRELGYELAFEKDRSNHWTFEICGVSKENIAEFSKRRSDILEAAKEAGREDAEGLAYIAKTTRANKAKCGHDELQQDWERRAISLGELRCVIPGNVVAVGTEKTDMRREIAHAIGVLSDREAVFAKEKLVAEVVKQTRERCTIQAIEAGVGKCMEMGDLWESRGNAGMLTTPANLRAERDVIELMCRMQHVVRPIMGKEAVGRELRGAELTVGQMEAVVAVLSTRDQVVGVQGGAGTGKTTVLRHVVQLAAERGHELLGLAPTKAAAVVMEQHAEVEAMTLDRILKQYAGVLAGHGTQEGLRRMQGEFCNKIVVLDEASLVPTEKMGKLLRLVKMLEFRVVLIGDTKQLGAIEAGKPFHYLQEHGMETVTMDHTKRQQNEALREVVSMSAGSVDREDFARHANKIFSKLGDGGIVEVGSGATNAAFADAVYAKWKACEDKNVLIVVPSNALRQEVNARIRPHFVSGRDFAHVVLHSKLLTKTQLHDCTNYHAGDVILLAKSGEYWEVVAVKEHMLVLRNEHGTYECDAGKLGHAQVFEKRVLQLAVGDKIRWTKNGNGTIVNGGEARIRAISEKKVTVETADGRKVKLSKSDPDLQHIDHNYSATTYGAQGATVDHVIGVARAHERFLDLTTQRSLYVTLSRARHGATIFTENKAALARSLGKKTGAKASAIEHQREKRLVEYPVDLQRQGREVFIDVQRAMPETRRFVKNEQSFENFTNNPELIRDMAERTFGDANPKLSKHHQLRFGAKGSVTVNLQTGQWYDFSSGGGGSLYKFYNDEVRIERGANTSKTRANGQSTIQKLIAVEKIAKNGISGRDPRATLLQKYLTEHRGIDLREIRLSDDVRFAEKLWNSEKKRYEPGVVAVARKDGKRNAVQVTFLDKNTANKNKNLDVAKRSMGVVRGSFVELTKNTTSHTVFIAEGVETALSIAQAEPHARVLCSLGVANMRNLELGDLRGKTIVICADNDGPDSHTNMVVERAAASLKENGARTVTIIRPTPRKLTLTMCSK